MRRLTLAAVLIAFTASACTADTDPDSDPRTSSPGQTSIEVGPGTQGAAIEAAIAAGEALRDHRARSGEYPRDLDAAVEVLDADTTVLADHRLAGYERAKADDGYAPATLCLEAKDEDGPWAVYSSHVDSTIGSGETGGCPSHWS